MTALPCYGIMGPLHLKCSVNFIVLQKVAMQSVLEHVSTCHSVSQQLGLDTASHPKDPTPSLLALYEFEAKLLLGGGELGVLLERVVQLPHVEAKTLETMAALCIRSGDTGTWL